MKTIFTFFSILSALLAKPLCAEIVFTDVEPDSIVSATAQQEIKSFFVDLDKNGVYEFELRHFNPGDVTFVELHRNFEGNQENAITSQGHAKVLVCDDTISSNSTLWGGDQYGVLDAPWSGGGDKYIGARIMIDGQWRYGWIRVRIPSDNSNFTIMDFAYNTAPGASILAGQTHDASAPEENFTVAVCPNPFFERTEISFPRELLNAELVAYNSAGAVIQRVEGVRGSSYIFDREALPAGIYYCVIRDGGRTYAISLEAAPR